LSRREWLVAKRVASSKRERELAFFRERELEPPFSCREKLFKSERRERDRDRERRERRRRERVRVCV
jgi:hypothetical protein